VDQMQLLRGTRTVTLRVVVIENVLSLAILAFGHMHFTTFLAEDWPPPRLSRKMPAP